MQILKLDNSLWKTNRKSRYNWKFFSESTRSLYFKNIKIFLQKDVYLMIYFPFEERNIIII